MNGIFTQFQSESVLFLNGKYSKVESNFGQFRIRPLGQFYFPVEVSLGRPGYKFEIKQKYRMPFIFISIFFQQNRMSPSVALLSLVNTNNITPDCLFSFEIRILASLLCIHHLTIKRKFSYVLDTATYIP